MYNATNSAPHRPSSYRVDALRTLSLRSTAQLNDLFVTSRRSAPLLPAGLRSAPPRNATICLLRRIAPRRSFPQLYTPFGSAPLRNATQRFVCQFIAAAQRSAPQLHATCRSAPASRLHASRGNLTLLNATN